MVDHLQTLAFQAGRHADEFNQYYNKVYKNLWINKKTLPWTSSSSEEHGTEFPNIVTHGFLLLIVVLYKFPTVDRTWSHKAKHVQVTSLGSSLCCVFSKCWR